MKLTSKFDYPSLKFDKENEAILMLTLEAPSADDVARKPLNLVAVLDVSGSMAGDKIESMKKTMSTLIDHMTDKDRLGIVVFSTNYSKLADPELMTSSRKDELKTRVLGLNPMESTNISGGMMMGFETLSSKKEVINRVLLFTDGLPNIGVSTIPGLVELVSKRGDGLSISTFGYGLDHNPELLQSMAKVGDGNYYYIETPDSIMNSFAQELGGLVSCYGQNIKIEVDFKPGVKDVEVLNKAYDWKYDPEKLTIRIPDIYAEETKHILVKLKLEARSSALPRDINMGDICVKFVSLKSNKEESVEEKAKIKFVKDDSEVAARDNSVAKEEARLAAAEAQKKAAELAAAGQFQQAQQIMVMACNHLANVGHSSLLAEAQDMTNHMNAHSYDANYGRNMLRSCYSNSTGRAGGQSVGTSGFASYSNSIQKGMVESFTSDKIVLDNQKPKKHKKNSEPPKK